MADYQLGDNLYGNDQGQYWSIANGMHNVNGQQVGGNYKNWQTSPWDTAQGQINNMYGAQQKQQVDALNQQKQAALGGINQQQQASNQGFTTQRNQADVTNAQNVQRMREVMAQNGLNMSGENITATAGLNAQRQGAFNDINQKQNDANAQFNQQIADAKAKYDPSNVIDSINAQKSQALMQAFNNYLARMDQQRSQYQSLQQHNADQAQQLSEFNLGQSQNQGQFNDTLSMDKYKTDMTAALQKALGSTPSQADIQAILQAAGFQGSKGGGGTSSGAKGTAAFNANLAAANKQGVDPSWNDAMTYIVGKESGYDPNAANPTSTARGYAQFLASTRQAYQKQLGLDYNNPVDQLVMMQQYLKDRYKTPQGALAFWQKNHWY